VHAAAWLAGCAVVVACHAPTPPDRSAQGSPPQRIVVIAPAAAEMLDALGAADRIVGVGDFVDRPEFLAGLPRLGAYDAPNLERILELRADLVVTSDAVASAPAARRLQALGVEVLALETDTFEGTLRALETLGARLGLADRAAARAASVRAAVEDVGRRAAGLARRRVLCVVGRDPLFVAGPGSHLDVLIAAAGGINVARDVGAPYARMSVETALERMPEVIVEASDHRPAAFRGRAPGLWAAWEFLPAVHEGRVYWIDPDRVVVPGMRMGETAELLARMIHPEAFGEAGLEELGAPGTAGAEHP